MYRLGGFFLILLILLVLFAPGGFAVPVSAATPVGGLLNTPTPLPPNPAALDRFDLALSAAQGAGFVLALFLIFGIYLALRGLLRER